MLYPSPLHLCALLSLLVSVSGLPVELRQTVLATSPDTSRHHDATILILGGGVTGVIAARTLHEQGVSDFIIVEARDELGGRMMSHTLGKAEGKQYTVEVGANWVQGTRRANGSGNPIWDLANKHKLVTHRTNLSSMTTYDDAGLTDYLNVFKASADHYANLVSMAGVRVPQRLVDMTARGGYSLTGSKPDTRYAAAAEYFQFDWEFGATPEETSWVASSWAHNHTFKADAGGFSGDNMLSLDKRGFKMLIQEEAREFLEPQQLRLSSTVHTISHSKSGVQITLEDGTTLRAKYALCTFSLGVLQNDDVRFDPPLPGWKQEAIYSMSMGTFTKIFLQFEEKFWFDTELGLYADYERGRYPVWQSLDHAGLLPGSGIMMVTVTGEFSKRIESLPDEGVQAEVLSTLQSMFPGTEIPAPLDFYFQRWHSDPLFRGSYSNWPASFLSEHQANLRANVDERLWFAGEATSRKHFGFLHGAYFEGLGIGHTLAKCINGGGCVGQEHVERVRNAMPYDAV